MLAENPAWGRDGVTKAVAEALDFTGNFQQNFDEDAGAIDYRKIEDNALDTLRLRVYRAMLRSPLVTRPSWWGPL